MTWQNEHLGMAPAHPCMTELVQEQAAEIARLRDLCRRVHDMLRTPPDEYGADAGRVLMSELADAATEQTSGVRE